MFQKLITYSIRHKLVVGVFTIALIVWGIVSLIHLPSILRRILPTIRFRSSLRRLRSKRRRWSNTLLLRWKWRLPTSPNSRSEEHLAKRTLGAITLVFDDDVDIYWARSQVSQMLTQVEKDLPKISRKPRWDRFATGLGEIYHYTVRAEKGYDSSIPSPSCATIQDSDCREQQLWGPRA